MRTSKLLMLLVLFCGHNPALAVEPASGQIYPGGTRIGGASYGLEFTIPQSFQGGLDGEVFVMQATEPSANLLLMAESTSLEQAKVLMQGPIPISPFIQLELQNPLEQQGLRLSGEYSVSSNAQLHAMGQSLSLENGLSVAAFLISQKSELARHQAALEQLMGSIKAVSATAKTQNTGSQSAEETDTSWQNYLRGKHIVRFFSGSSYTEEQHLWLCSNGQFVRRFNSGGFSGGASGATQAKYDGHWQANGTGETGQLTLQSPSGVSTYQLRWDYDQSRLYLDGKRWLHSDNQLCP